MNQENQMPAGYMLVGTMAIHVASVREFTADIERFKRCLPLAERIEKHELGTPEWHKCVAEILDENPSIEFEDIAATFEESAEIVQAACAELRDRFGQQQGN